MNRRITIEVLDVKNKTVVNKFNDFQEVSTLNLVLEFSPNNNCLAILCEYFLSDENIVDRFFAVRITNVIHNKEIEVSFQIPNKDIALDNSPPDLIQFSPDGKFLYAVITHTGNLFIWEVNTGTLCIDLPPQGTLSAYDFSVDGKYFAISIEPEDSINNDENSVNEISSKLLYTIQIWDMFDTKIIYEKKFNSPIPHLTFSPDGKYLATASEDYTARIWEIETGKEVIRLPHQAVVDSVSFTPDGKVLVTSSTDGMIRGWLIFPEDLISDASSRLTRNLTEDEWRQYFGENAALEPYRKTCQNLD